MSFLMHQSEAQFQQAVTQAATMYGWEWMHIQPGLTERGRYRSPVSGPLGPGWPDLVLVKGTRLIFAELKAQRGTTTPLQRAVLLTLSSVGEVYVWKPSDWALIMEVLLGGTGDERPIPQPLAELRPYARERKTMRNAGTENEGL